MISAQIHSSTNMTELTLEKVTESHDAIILRYGGANGILCLGTVDYLVDQVNGEGDPFKKASLALNIVITCHPFMDGNKRTAFQLAELILSENGYHIQADLGEKVRALTRIAEYKCSVDDIEAWIRKKVGNP
jgi:death on curing protein